MSAIPASSVNLKTMADGTLRISFDIEPVHAQDAFKLFAAPGTQAAIAALKAGTYLDQPKDPEKPKGGELARLAGIWCNEPKFWRWIRTVDQGRLYEIDNDMQAAAWIREVCSVESRAELDHNKEAGDYFHEAIRLPYMDYLRADQ